MNYRKMNLRALAEAGLSGEIFTAGGPPEDIPAVAAANGSVTAVRRGVFVHSRFDPEKEARRLVENSLGPGDETAVFYGFGLGYHIEAFFAARPDGRAIVLEPEPAYFHAVLGLRDYSDIFRRRGFRLLLGAPPEMAARLIAEFEDDSFRILRLRSVHCHNSEYYSCADEALSRLASRREINLNTLKRFGKLWVRNLSRNIRLIRNNPGIRLLTDAFAGLPALVAAAGPSLDSVLPHLAEIRKRCLIIAVDTSYSACLRHGVEPDFVVVVDPQYWNSRHLDRTRQEKTILVSESSTHPRVFRLLPGQMFLAGSIFPLGRYLEEASDLKGKLGAGGSVATSAWDFARLLGARPIIMAGLDLGFPGRNTHYRGSFFEERAFFTSCRFLPGETQSCAYLYEAGPRMVPANDGTSTLTDRRMLIYIWWFESQMKMHPDVQTLTLSGRGARIDGIEPADIDGLLALPEKRIVIDRVLAGLRDIPHPPADGERFQTALDNLSAELLRLEALCGKGLDQVRRLREASSAGPAPDLAVLDGIDKSILSLENRDIAGFLLAETLLSLKPPDKDADAATVLDNTEKIYSTLLESAAYHRAVLNAAGEVSSQGSTPIGRL